MAKLPDELAAKGVTVLKRAHPVLWWCPRCNIYFARVRTWTQSACHRREYRMGAWNAALVSRPACGGVASPLRDGAELAAYLIGGLEAVYAMGKRVN